MSTPEQQKIMQKMKNQAKGAWKTSRTKDPVVGGSLPPGIVGGIARFSDYALKEKDGKISVSLTGIVVRPEELAGQRATKMHFLSDSEYNTIQDAYDGLYSDIQLLGIDTTDSDHEDLEQIFADLEELKAEHRAFKFNTSQSNPKARVKVWIQGLPDEDELREIEAESEGDKPEEDEEAEGEDYAEEDESDSEAESEADSEGGEPEEDEEDWVPEKGEEYGFMYKKNPKSRAKKIIVKISSVNQSKQTVTFKDPTGKSVTVGWDKLVSADDE